MNGYISSKEIESITKNLLAEKPEETRQFQTTMTIFMKI